VLETSLTEQCFVLHTGVGFTDRSVCTGICTETQAKYTEFFKQN